MRSAILILAFFGQFSSRPPDVSLADPTPDFPLPVHLIATRYGTDTTRAYRSIQGELRGGPGYLRPTGSYRGYGSGNLLGEPTRGFDYTFDCPAPFAENNGKIRRSPSPIPTPTIPSTCTSSPASAVSAAPALKATGRPILSESHPKASPSPSPSSRPLAQLCYVCRPTLFSIIESELIRVT